jgi:hypothetical protein
MKKKIHKLFTGIVLILPVCFFASCDLTGPQGEPGTDGRDAAAIEDTAFAVDAALAAKTGTGEEDDPWLVKISGVDISDPDAYRHIIHGVTSALEEGDIALDLSGCSGGTFAYVDGVNTADKLRIVSILLPASLIYIIDGRKEYGAFHGYLNLAGISAPGLIHIGDYAFYSPGALNAAGDIQPSNEALTIVDFPEVRSVGAYAFYCPNLISISLPKAESIGDYAFYGSSSASLTVVNLPAAITIGNYAFNYWRNIASINLPEVVSIGNNAFQAPPNLMANTALTALSLPKCETIGDRAFNYYTSLETVNLPVVKTIGTSAFYAGSLTNTALTALDLTTVTSIGNSAFAYCTALTTLTLGPTVPTLPTKSTSASNGIFLQTAPSDNGTITIQVPGDKQSDYATAGWKSVAYNDNTQTDTIKFGTNHKAITISTY